MPLEKNKIKEILENLPPCPGVYKMKNEEGKIIYIGKAKNLSKRVPQYFLKNYQHSTRTRKLLENLADIEFTAVDSELEAIILENNLIKQFLPRYNIIMKDDKNFVYIKITEDEDYPRIQIVRKVEKDKAKYIGPKSAAHKVKETFKLLKKLFPFRHCNLDIEYLNNNEIKIVRKNIKYPCIDYYIKRCPGPCTGKISPEQYKEIIKKIEEFLLGKGENILKELNEQMKKEAQNRNFEKAAKIRDKIKKVENILEVQKVSDPNQEDKDIINYCITQDQAFFNLFQVRDGKLIGQENFILKAKESEEGTEDPEVLSAFLMQFYEISTDIPKEIIIPHEIEDKEELREFISAGSNKKVNLIIPQKGTKNKLLEMSLNNARIFADRNKSSWQKADVNSEKAIKELQTNLKLDNPPNRIECYDISHLSGTDTVGSMIVFEKGIPVNRMYRKFHLRTVQGKPDDFKAMQEVLFRRFSKIVLELKQKEHILTKALKKDQKFILQNKKVDFKKNHRQFFLLKKENNIEGFVSVSERSDNIAELTNLWIDEKFRGKKLGYKLIKGAISKAKAKRIYIICKTELKEYYALIGFEEIKKIPEELITRVKEIEKQRDNVLIMVFDKTKHKDDESFIKIPDLVVIDGGKGQLSAAEKVFKELELNISVISLAKQLEEIFIPGRKNSLILEKNNEALRLLQRARDEAHRFAISYNRNLRSKRIKTK